MKRVIGDLLSIILGRSEEDYEPTKNEYLFFWILIAVIISFVTAMQFN